MHRLMCVMHVDHGTCWVRVSTLQHRLVLKHRYPMNVTIQPKVAVTSAYYTVRHFIANNQKIVS